MGKIPLGVQLYSVREASAQDFPAAIKSVADIGFEAVEFAGYHGLDAKTLKGILDDLNLKCAGTHTGLASVQGDELAKTAEFNLTFGNPYLVVPGVGPEYQGTLENVLKLADALTKAHERAAKYGAFVGYHNHGWEMNVLENGSNGMDVIAANTPDDFVLQIDTGNAQDGGGDPLPLLKKWNFKAKTAHLKPHAKDFSNYFIGEDDTDWPAVLATFENAPTAFFIVEQERYPEPNTPLECLKRCYDNLRKLGV